VVTSARFHAITNQYAKLRIAVAGDFCLDRYLEIDPARSEVSIETGLPVHNVVNVRSQPGGAGTILNNLAALGMSAIFPVGFAGDDGEGYELCRTLAARPSVRLHHFIQTSERRTFTYCKPLVIEPGKAPRELNRLDQKNWTPTSAPTKERLIAALQSLSGEVNALVLLGQVDEPETGVLTSDLLRSVARIAEANPELPISRSARKYLLSSLAFVVSSFAGLESSEAGSRRYSWALPAASAFNRCRSAALAKGK
jgi:bifunctional ADP-heptose synthase (sugar kinase/adenylyltransferase)